MVLDEKGKKMSKSIGNVINSIEIISQYGSDALRLGIISNRSAGQDQAFNISRVIDGRNFCNKLWNIARFIENRVGESYKNSPFEPITPADHWIVRQLNSATTDISQKIESYRLSEAKDALYHAIWDNVADWYVEASKQQDNGPMLTWVLDTCLKLAHPFAPFVTETIWQTLSWHNNLLITSNWPKETQYDDIAAAEFSRLKKLVTEIRFVVSELPDNDQYSLLYQNDSLIADNVQLIQKLANLKDVQAVDQARGLRLAASGREAWLDVSAKTLYEHQTNLEARLAETHNQIALLEARLNNEDYIKKAPADLIENSKDQLELQKALSQRLIKELEIIK
jgi:valyl-tRNA synthetase